MLQIPTGARAAVSAALAGDQSSWRITGMSVYNPAQHLAARFGAEGAAISSGSFRFDLNLAGVGHRAAIRPAGSAMPQLSHGLVLYRYPGVTQTWRNGPLGLEQSFVITRRPSGAGPMTLTMPVPHGSRLVGNILLLPGGLRYSGLEATDAHGVRLRSWLSVADGRLLIEVADRSARYPVRVDPLVQQADLSPADGTAGDYVGSYISMSGHTLVVGAPSATVDAVGNAGAVYVFSQISGHWKQTAELTVPGEQASEGLGSAVAISGNTIVASGPVYSGTPSATATTQQGALFVFTHSAGHWRLVATLKASDPSAAARLGEYSVAISGRTIVAGEPEHENASGKITGEGAVYVYSEPGGGWRNSTETAEITEQRPETDDSLGETVAISGHTIAAGAPAPYPQFHHEPGVLLFKGAGRHWHQIAEVHVRSQGTFVSIGQAIAISGGILAVGSSGGDVYAFQARGGHWKLAANLTYAAPCVDGTCPSSTLGGSVAIVNDVILSSTSALSTRGSTDGAVAIPEFKEVGRKWRLVSQNIVGNVPAGNETLGGAVAGDGDTVAVGLDDGEIKGSVAILKGHVTGFGPLVGTLGVSGTAVAVPVTCEVAHGSCKVTLVAHKAGTGTVIGSGSGTIPATGEKSVLLKFNSAGEHLLSKGFTAKITVREYGNGKLIAATTISQEFTPAG